jgi:sulfate permease, SulP family
LSCWPLSPEAIAFSIIAGVLLSGVFFAAKIAQILRVTSEASADGLERRYIVAGQLFYTSVDDFTRSFDSKEALDKVIIDLGRAQIWDISSVAAVDMVVLKFRREVAIVELVGMNAATETIVDRLALHDKPGAMEQLQSH